MAEVTKIKLVQVKNKDKSLDLTIKHAEDLLNYQAKKKFNDWELPANSGYKFENGNINPVQGSGADQKSGK